MNLATATEARIGTRSLNSMHYGATRIWRRPTWPTVAEMTSTLSARILPLAISSTTAAIRGNADVVLYDITGENFSQRGQTITGDWGMSPYASISLDGNTVVIGWTGRSAIPCVKVFDWNGSGWVQRGATITSTTGRYFGTKTAISAEKNKIVISEAKLGGFSTGSLKTYIWNDSQWQEQDIYQGEPSTFFGLQTSMSLSSDGLTLAADSPQYSTKYFIDTGLIRVFSWNGTGWSPSQDITGTWHFQNFGSGGVALDGNKMIVGIPNYRTPETSQPITGKVILYHKINGSFVEYSSKLGTQDNVIGGNAFISGQRIFFNTAKGGICYDISNNNWVQVGEPFPTTGICGVTNNKVLGSSRRVYMTGIPIQGPVYKYIDFVTLKVQPPTP